MADKNLAFTHWWYEYHDSDGSVHTPYIDNPNDTPIVGKDVITNDDLFDIETLQERYDDLLLNDIELAKQMSTDEAADESKIKSYTLPGETEEVLSDGTRVTLNMAATLNDHNVTKPTPVDETDAILVNSRQIYNKPCVDDEIQYTSVPHWEHNVGLWHYAIDKKVIEVDDEFVPVRNQEEKIEIRTLKMPKEYVDGKGSLVHVVGTIEVKCADHDISKLEQYDKTAIYSVQKRWYTVYVDDVAVQFFQQPIEYYGTDILNLNFCIYSDRLTDKKLYLGVKTSIFDYNGANLTSNHVKLGEYVYRLTDRTKTDEFVTNKEFPKQAVEISKQSSGTVVLPDDILQTTFMPGVEQVSVGFKSSKVEKYIIRFKEDVTPTEIFINGIITEIIRDRIVEIPIESESLKPDDPRTIFYKVGEEKSKVSFTATESTKVNLLIGSIRYTQKYIGGTGKWYRDGVECDSKQYKPEMGVYAVQYANSEGEYVLVPAERLPFYTTGGDLNSIAEGIMAGTKTDDFWYGYGFEFYSVDNFDKIFEHMLKYTTTRDLSVYKYNSGDSQNFKQIYNKTTTNQAFDCIYGPMFVVKHRDKSMMYNDTLPEIEYSISFWSTFATNQYPETQNQSFERNSDPSTEYVSTNLSVKMTNPVMIRTRKIS